MSRLKRRHATGKLAEATMLRMALRISVVIVVASLFSYFHLMRQLETGVKEQLELFVRQRAEVESQWLFFLEQKLVRMRTEYVERYQRLKGQDAVAQFNRYFALNDDGSAYVRPAFYSGAAGEMGISHSGYSGGIEKARAMTAERRIRLTLAMQMLFEHCPSIVMAHRRDEGGLPPFVNCYFFFPEKDLLIYWPNTPWYPDYAGGFDLAAQGDFRKTFDASLPMEKRDRLWSGTYMDEVPKVWMASFTMPISIDGKTPVGLGADISLDEMNNRLRNVRFRGAENFIIRADGQLIAAPTLLTEMLSLNGDFNLTRDGNPADRSIQRLIADHPGQAIIEDRDNDRLLAVANIAGPDWLFVATYPKQQMASTVAQTVLFIFLLGVLSLVVEVWMLWRVLRQQIAQPLMGFAQVVRKISQGNLSPRVLDSLPVGRQDEIGMLAGSFGDMVLQLISRNESLAKLSAAVEQSPAVVVITDLNGKIEYVNQAFSLQTGYTFNDVRGRNPRLLQSGKTPAETYEALWRDLKNQAVWRGEFINQRKDGSQFTAAALVSQIRNADGVPTHYLAIMEDVSALRRAEEERRSLEKQLQLSQKSQALGQLTGGIAHDFNNLLTAILGYSTLALTRFVDDPDSKLAMYLRQVVAAGERGRNLVAKLLTFARTDHEARLQELHPADLVNEVVGMMRPSIPSGIRFEVNVASQATILGNADELNQILVNLIINARDAIGEQGMIGIRVHVVDIADAVCSASTARFAGTFLSLDVRDDGCGIAPENLQRIFDPFFTTKEFGQGTGLGLSMVQGIMRRAHGYVLVTSVSGHGTQFQLLFPIATPDRPLTA